MPPTRVHQVLHARRLAASAMFMPWAISFRLADWTL